MWKEFKEFAVKGNALDLAIGVIIGAAFGKIVTSLVDDILMPPLSVLTGKIDFSNLFIALNGAHYDTIQQAKAAGAPVLAYGSFLNNIVNFLLIAFAVFILVKQINKLKRGDESEPEGKQCPYCKQNIAVDATRCSHCTSQLEASAAAA